eukprot:TRINITY_DN1597_c0_g1_i3.p1 TRINITY_DN1597_c0_g1~~TRINITY_DN1597_c0_g1_i3.p1  ORF type:complete len:167 (-),score=25.26 TRINITY_DN1597_c0_g1_i3:90-590(-)
MYFERQVLQRCAIHCLNNLFQERWTDVTMLDDIARELASRDTPSFLNQHKSILTIGNYGVNVLEIALQRRGFELKWCNASQQLQPSDLENSFGLIVNIQTWRLKFFPSRHWVAIRHMAQVGWVLFDSNMDTPIPLGLELRDVQVYLRERAAEGEVQVLRVVGAGQS